MCGRFTLTVSSEAVLELFQLAEGPPLRPRYNITPSQPVAVVRAMQGAASGQADGAVRELTFMRWGLIPHWAKEPGIGAKMINARAETAAEKPSFRTPFRRRRCLIAADGYYEWRGEGGKKQPYYIHMKHRGPFAFAGLWEHWTGPDGSEVETCAILTVDANALLRPVHHRMPVILEPPAFDPWLEPSQQERARLQPLLAPYAGEGLAFFPVSTHVNRPAHDDPACIAPLAEPGSP